MSVSGSPEIAVPIDEDLCEAVWGVVQDARRLFVEHRDSGAYISQDHNLFKFSRFDTGFPRINKDFGAKSTDYDGCFSLRANSRWSQIPFEEWDSFKQLVRLVEAHDRLRRSFLVQEVPQSDDGRRRDLFLIEVWIFAGGIFDRVMRLHGEDFSREDFTEVYCQLEAGHLRDRVEIAMAIPIALTQFESSEPITVGPDMAVMELSESIQLARIPTSPGPTSSANELVIGAATHALILTGWDMPNDNGLRSSAYDDIGWYPTEQIDRFFDALRIVTGLDTGYAQLFLLPLGHWAFRFERDQPVVVKGPVVRRYPPQFDNYGWLAERPIVTDEQLHDVGDVLQSLDSRDSIRLAARRLSAGMLREADDDRILDLLIGLEAALGDGSKGEMTYKLAVRAAAVLATVEPVEPGVIFGTVKRLYDYRSAVAHGNPKRAAKLRDIERDGETQPATDIAAEYLRGVLRALGRRQDLQKASDIDSKLVLRALRNPVNEEST